MSYEEITNPEFEFSLFIFNWWVLMSIISIANIWMYYEKMQEPEVKAD